MELQELIAEIEDGEIRADLQLASTTHALLERLEENPGIREARHRAAESPDVARRFLQRAVSFFATLTPPGYVHPDDLPLTAYLFILARVPARDIATFVDRVARENRPEFFRASSVARYFASRVPETTVWTEATSTVGLTRLAEKPRSWQFSDQLERPTDLPPNTTVSSPINRDRRHELTAYG